MVEKMEKSQIEKVCFLISHVKNRSCPKGGDRKSVSRQVEWPSVRVPRLRGSIARGFSLDNVLVNVMPFQMNEPRQLKIIIAIGRERLWISGS